jgi:hypothetical protein
LAEGLFFDSISAPKEVPKLPLLFSPAVLREKCASFSGVWNHDQETWEEFESLLQFTGDSWVVRHLTANLYKQIQISVTNDQVKLSIKPGFSMRAVWSCTIGCPLEATGKWGKWTKVQCKTLDQMVRARWCGGNIVLQRQPPKISPIYRELARRMLPGFHEMKGQGYMRTWVIKLSEATKTMCISMALTPLNGKCIHVHLCACEPSLTSLLPPGTNWNEWDKSAVYAKADLSYTKMQLD